MQIHEYAERLGNSYAFLFAVSLIAGVVIFNAFIGAPKVGIITLDTSFMSEKTKNEIVEMLRYAGDESQIKAVAMVIDSPGGEVSKVEEIYLEVLKLKEKKPVVVSVDSSALSGGYYIASAANFIYVKPSSEIGNIGVISTLPEPLKIEEERTITTGPFKIAGKSRREYAAQVEAIKQAFLLAVMSQRGDRLKLDAERLSQAEVFLGSEGVKYGLADAIGTSSDALIKAANIAGIANYEPVNINKALNITFEERFSNLAEHKSSTPMNYYFYVELTEK